MSIEPAVGPGARGEGVSPHSDDWGQDAVLDELMAAFGPGEDPDLPDDSFDPELAGSWPTSSRGLRSMSVPARCPSAWTPGSCRAAGRAGPGWCAAGLAPASLPARNSVLPCPDRRLAGFANDAAGSDRSYTDLNDDELIGTLVGWQKTEAWAASGRLSAVAELIRRQAHSAGREQRSRRETGRVGEVLRR